MNGTFLNMLAILVGTAIGILVGSRLSRNVQESVMTGLGLVTLTIGVQNALRSGNIILPLLGVVFGVILGELLDLDGAMKRLGGWLQGRVARLGAEQASRGPAADGSAGGGASAPVPDASLQARLRFINGFVTASLLFCIGPLAILGSIQNGINSQDIQLLAIKSTLDFFAAMAFAASLGIGVAFSILPTLVVQGGFALLGAGLAGALAGLGADNPYIREFTATGGLILMGISLGLLQIKQPRVANFLPALLITPLLILLASLLGIGIYQLGS